MTEKDLASREQVPGLAGGVSAHANSNAPFVYFDAAPAFGLLNGVGMLFLEAGRQVILADNKIGVDRVSVAHLRGTIEAIRSLRAACDGILLMAEPKPAGDAN